MHFCFPLDHDVTLCGELSEELSIISSINKVTCPKCKELIGEISRQVMVEESLKKSVAVGLSD